MREDKGVQCDLPATEEVAKLKEHVEFLEKRRAHDFSYMSTLSRKMASLHAAEEMARMDAEAERRKTRDMEKQWSDLKDDYRLLERFYESKKVEYNRLDEELKATKKLLAEDEVPSSPA